MIIQSDSQEYLRDTESKALINKDLSAFEQYKVKKKSEMELRLQVDSLNNEVRVMRDQLGTVLDLLKEIAGK